MSNVTITQFANYTSIFKAGTGIPELIIPRGAASFRTSKFDASGVIQQDDLIVVIYKDQEIPIRVLTDVITIKSSPTDSGVVFSSLSGTTVGKLLDLKIKLDEVFPKANTGNGGSGVVPAFPTTFAAANALPRVAGKFVRVSADETNIADGIAPKAMYLDNGTTLEFQYFIQ